MVKTETHKEDYFSPITHHYREMRLYKVQTGGKNKTITVYIT